MKYLKITAILFLIFSCKNNTKIELKNSKDDTLTAIKISEKPKPITEEKKSYLFPFGYELSNFKLDSINEYGAGDCWGKIKQVSKKELSIGIDSMSCGDYGFDYTFYLLNNNIIQIVHSKESETLIGYNNKKTEYLLTETIHDFRKSPFISYSRKDTVPTPNFELLKTEFDTRNIENSESKLNDLILEHEGFWKMEIDY